MSMLRRLDPLRSLTGRLLVIMLGVVLATTAAQFAFIQIYRGQIVEDNLVRLFLAEVEGARALLDSAAPEERGAVVGAFADRGFEVRQSLPPGIDPDAPAPLYMRTYEERIRRYAAPGLIFAWQQGTNPAIWAGFRAGGQPYWLPFYLSARTGEWRPMVVWFVMLAGIAIVTGVLITRLLNRPLQRFRAELDRALPALSPVTLSAVASSELRDIATGVNALTADLRARQQERELMLAGLSHDLRTPLTRIRLRTEVIETDGSDDIAAIQRDVANLARIVDRFGELVRSGHVAQGVTPDAHAVIAPLCNDWVGLGRRVDCEVEPVAVPIAPDQLARVVTNLVENALRYGREPVEVRLSAAGGAVRLSVRDAGEGIAEEDRETALRPFTRLDAARALPGGSGLGLFIVRRLAERSGAILDFAALHGFEVSLTWRIAKS